MIRILTGILIVIILAAAGYAGYTQVLAPRPPAATPAPAAAKSAEETGVVSAKGFVAPKRQARLAFKAPGRIQQILVGEGESVREGQALARLDDKDAKQRIAQAEAALASARAQLERVKAGPRAEEIAVAQANVGAARARLARTRAGPKPEEIEAARAAKEKAAAVVRAAQADYDRIKELATASARPEAVRLQQVTLDYETASAAYDALVRGATAEDIAIAQAAVDEALAQLALAQAGPRPQDVAVAQAGVDTAKLTLEQAQSALADLELAAPFAGVIAAKFVELGETASPAQPAFLLGDLSALNVETDDLSEVNVAPVKVGQAARVTLDALPGQTFSGKVIRIAAASVTKRGDVTYTVWIALDQGAAQGLKWGMTAFVDIQLK
ncbi:MAG: efflux RND transporter periplasmic adaptor subunit [Chloroflexi bacterium]|nr:efflux RND transporter periplasmic adaptor subunit [Chloroflexota bacterium]